MFIASYNRRDASVLKNFAKRRQLSGSGDSVGAWEARMGVGTLVVARVPVHDAHIWATRSHRYRAGDHKGPHPTSSSTPAPTDIGGFSKKPTVVRAVIL